MPGSGAGGVTVVLWVVFWVLAAFVGSLIFSLLIAAFIRAGTGDESPYGRRERGPAGSGGAPERAEPGSDPDEPDAG